MDDPVDSRRGEARRRRLARLADRVSGWLLPPRCVLCGAGGQAPCLDLCRDCERILPLAAEPLQPIPGGSGTCFAPFQYAYPLAHLVHALKYRGQLAVGRVLGTVLARHLAERWQQREVDVVLPVPLHPARHASRGYNQSAEIARWVARSLERPLEPRLARRRRNTPAQVGLDPGARRANLERAFAAVAGLGGRHIAIVDDVTTTGSTLRALSEALMEGGAASVVAWCVCRTPGLQALDLPRQSKDTLA